MPSDAEVVEVLAEWFLGADWHKGTSANEISSEALAALRSAGYAVVKAGELAALVLAADRLLQHGDEEQCCGNLQCCQRPGRECCCEPECCGQPITNRHRLYTALTPFTKDPTNAP